MQSRSFVYACLLLLMASAARGQWVQQESGTTENLQGISAPNVAIATVVGENATILMTVNCGMDWTPQTGEPGVNYRAVSCVGATGLAAGTGGTISFTTNGGSVWQTIETGWMHPYFAAHQPTSTLGGVAGVNSVFQPLIGRSTNGWLTHDFLIFYPFFNGSNHEGTITDIYFFTADSCIATVSLTEGGGAICWTAQVSFGGWETQLVHDQPFYGLDFWDDQHAVAVGAGGLVTVTANGGWTWQERDVPTNDALTDVSYGSENDVWVVGEFGTILHSNNAGLTWNLQTSPIMADLNSVSFANADTGYIAGQGGTVLYTANGGASANQPPGEFVRAFPQDSVISDSMGWLKWTRSIDPDGDSVTYVVHLRSDYSYQFSPDSTYEYSTSDTVLDLGIMIPLSPLDEIFHFWWSVFATDGQDTVEAANGEGMFLLDIIVSAHDDFFPQPSSLSLSAYPNPFNPTTTLNVSLPVSSEAVLRVFDVTGRLVRETRLGRLESGSHEVAFDGSALPSGVYLATFETPIARVTQKLVLMK